MAAYRTILRVSVFGRTVKAKKRKATMSELVDYGIPGLTVVLGIALYLDLH
jgi:hypothetical protein